MRMQCLSEPSVYKSNVSANNLQSVSKIIPGGLENNSRGEGLRQTRTRTRLCRHATVTSNRASARSRQGQFSRRRARKQLLCGFCTRSHNIFVSSFHSFFIKISNNSITYIWLGSDCQKNAQIFGFALFPIPGFDPRGEEELSP